MIEQTFDSRSERRGATGNPDGVGAQEYSALVDGFRCRETPWLRRRREWLVREQRRLHLEELAVTRVLDERGAIDDSLAQADGVSIRSVRDTVATARALEELPAIAAVAAEGRLSGDQLTQVVKVADPGDPSADARWAAEAPGWSPSDLAHQARIARTPTMAEANARQAAREMNFGMNADVGMLLGDYAIPDLDGALAASVFDHMIDQMVPVPGQPWPTRKQRAADALMILVRNYAEQHALAGPQAHLIVEVPLEGPATVAGVPLPDAMVEALRAQARIEPVLVDQNREPVAVGRTQASLSAKTLRSIRTRDGKCRIPGCAHRYGLEVHHLWPRSWGGTDEKANLAAVCHQHHRQLVPQGELMLLGNPNRPDGLRLVHRDHLNDLAGDQTAPVGHDPPSSESGDAPAPSTRPAPRDNDDHVTPDARAGPEVAA